MWANEREYVVVLVHDHQAGAPEVGGRSGRGQIHAYAGGRKAATARLHKRVADAGEFQVKGVIVRERQQVETERRQRIERRSERIIDWPVRMTVKCDCAPAGPAASRMEVRATRHRARSAACRGHPLIHSPRRGPRALHGASAARPVTRVCAEAARRRSRYRPSFPIDAHQRAGHCRCGR